MVTSPLLFVGYNNIMKQVEYQVKHQYQPTATSCSPTALSMLLSYYNKEITVAQISSDVPQVRNAAGETFGTINQQLATWCISQGFRVNMYTFDCQIIDQSWANLSNEEIIDRLEARKDGWVVPSLGEVWNKAYVESYIEYIRAGGELYIWPGVTTKLLYELLENGPIFACVSFSTLHGLGRSNIRSKNESVPDDVYGRALNHSIVIYGVDDTGNFLIADPDKKPGFHVIEPERMIAAISTAQIECDNLLFQLESSK